MADPTGTLERELGATLPEGIRLTVVEETPTRRCLVLPPAPMPAGGELPDQELAAVAGGYPGPESYACRRPPPATWAWTPPCI